MQKTILTLVTLAFIGLSTANAQVGIGTENPENTAALDVDSNEKGFLPPRMDTDARNNINSPAEGLTIYNTDVNCVQFFEGSLWFDLCEGGLIAGAPSDCDNVPFLSAEDTQIVEVTNPVTNQTWMDRNLGAFTADRSTPGPAGGTDCWAYGNLYQWGRNSDGHEDRSSNTAADPVAAGNEGSDFITVGAIEPFDWLSPQDDDRWNANETAGGSVVKTANDPCPDGYRVPTRAEWEVEWDSWDGTLDNQVPPSSNNNREGAITSPLKLPAAGIRSRLNGAISGVGPDFEDSGSYWSSTVDQDFYAVNLQFFISGAFTNPNDRANGNSVRCIKD